MSDQNAEVCPSIKSELCIYTIEGMVSVNPMEPGAPKRLYLTNKRTVQGFGRVSQPFYQQGDSGYLHMAAGFTENIEEADRYHVMMHTASWQQILQGLMQNFSSFHLLIDAKIGPRLYADGSEVDEVAVEALLQKREQQRLEQLAKEQLLEIEIRGFPLTEEVRNAILRTVSGALFKNGAMDPTSYQQDVVVEGDRSTTLIQMRTKLVGGSYVR